MTKEEYELYVEGVITGLTAFAYWKDGVQYVGTCGTTLKQAVQLAVQLAEQGKLYGQRGLPCP